MSQATDRLTLPWRELIDGFIDGLHRLGPSNSMQYQHQRQLTFFGPAHRRRRPGQATRRQLLVRLDSERRELERKKRAQSLRNFYAWATLSGHLSTNPASRLTTSRHVRPDRRWTFRRRG